MNPGLWKLLLPPLVLAAGFAVYALLHAARPLPGQTAEQPRPTRVHIVRTQIETAALQVHSQGEVRSRTEVDLVAQVGGRVVAVSPEFIEGGLVEPGVPLLQIEDTDYRLALDEARARVAEAELAVEQALADADVARQQLRGDPDPSDLALKKPQVTQARARLVAARSNLERAELDLERTRVTLPFPGRVMNTRVDQGQYITPGAILGRAFSTQVVEVRLALDNAQLEALGLPIGYIAPDGSGPVVHFSAEIAGSREEWHGRLVRLDASVDPDTRMLYATAALEDPYGANVSASGMPLAVGLFVDAVIEGHRVENAVTIPRPALRAGDIVYLINSRGRLEIRRVQVVHSDPDHAVLSGGLGAGEQVVTSAIRNPITGMPLEAIPADTGTQLAVGS